MIVRSKLLVALIAATALLAACGGDDSETSSAGTDNAPTTADASPAPTGSPLKLALMNDKSGPGSNGQDAASDVAEAWVEYTNSHGGVAGHPVQLTVKDTKGDAPTGQSMAAEVAGDSSVLGALVVDSSGESSYAKTLSQGQLPVIGGIGYHPTIWGALPNVFGITTQFPTVVNMQVLAAKDVGAKSVGVAACAEVDSCAAAAPVYEAAAGKAGLKYNGLVKIANSASTFTAECLQFINGETDVIQLSAGGAVGIRLFSDCVQQGFTGYLGATAGTVQPALYNGDPSIKLAGALNSFPWWVDDEPVKQFRALMEAGGVDAEVYGQPVATATYASLELFKKALESDTALPAAPTRTDILAAYGKVKDETLDGLLPQPLSFTPGQPGPKVSCFWFYKYEDQEFAGEFTPDCDTTTS